MQGERQRQGGDQPNEPVLGSALGGESRRVLLPEAKFLSFEASRGPSTLRKSNPAPPPRPFENASPATGDGPPGCVRPAGGCSSSRLSPARPAATSTRLALARKAPTRTRRGPSLDFSNYPTLGRARAPVSAVFVAAEHGCGRI
jgi:hypothetical protein